MIHHVFANQTSADGELAAGEAIRTRILVVSASIPFPPIGGGPMRTFHILRALSAHNDVTLAGFAFGNDSILPDFPIEVISIPWELPRLYREMQSEDQAAAEHAADMLERGTAEPWFVSFYNCPRMAETLRSLSARHFDLILVEDTDMARFLPYLSDSIPKILDFHNVYSLMARRAAAVAQHERGEREARRTIDFEAHAAQSCSLTFACSSLEAEAVNDLLRVSHVEVIPNGVDTQYFAPDSTPAQDNYILFTGTMNHPPNEEAACHFVAHILPLIRARLPAVMVHLVGKDPTPRVLALEADGIVVHGYVPDIRAYFRDATVVVAPILSGGGTRLKILEAGACRKAVVSTHLGAEGLGLEHDRHLLLADDPSAFADAVCRVMMDAVMRERLGAAIRTASLGFDWALIEAKVSRIVTQLASDRAIAARPEIPLGSKMGKHR